MPMHIKSISWLHHINFGGVENRAYNIARFSSKFADVEFLFAKTLFSSTNYQNKVNFRYTPIQIYLNPYKFYRKRFWEEFFIKKTTIYLESRKNEIDVVHGQGISGIVGINLGVPTITTIRGMDRWGENPPKLEKMVVEKSNKLIAVTKHNQSLLFKRGVKKEKISVIYPGVNFNLISNTKVTSKELMIRHGVDPEKKIILSVHNFHKVKNTIGILNPFVDIKRKYPDYQLVLIGDGAERQYYVDYVKRKKIKDVHFIGRLIGKELRQFYKSADIFLLPSFSDTFPLTCLEAMAAKCAVILTKNTKMLEIAENKKHIISVDPYSQQDIKNALITLIENNNLKEQLKENGYKLAQTLSWDKQCKLFLDILREMMI